MRKIAVLVATIALVFATILGCDITPRSGSGTAQYSYAVAADGTYTLTLHGILPPEAPIVEPSPAISLKNASLLVASDRIKISTDKNLYTGYPNTPWNSKGVLATSPIRWSDSDQCDGTFIHPNVFLGVKHQAHTWIHWMNGDTKVAQQGTTVASTTYDLILTFLPKPMPGVKPAEFLPKNFTIEAGTLLTIPLSRQADWGSKRAAFLQVDSADDKIVRWSPFTAAPFSSWGSAIVLNESGSMPYLDTGDKAVVFTITQRSTPTASQREGVLLREGSPAFEWVKAEMAKRGYSVTVANLSTYKAK